MNNKIQEIKSKSYELMNYIDDRVYPFFARIDTDVYEELMDRARSLDADISKLEGMMPSEPLTAKQWVIHEDH